LFFQNRVSIIQSCPLCVVSLWLAKPFGPGRSVG
jgi:hypothetical protein